MSKQECQLMSESGVFIQILLGVLCMAGLLESPQRKMKIFLLDTFKQVFTQLLIHFINVGFSKVLTDIQQKGTIKADECSWYFMIFLIDLFPGLLITFLLSKLYDNTFEKCGWHSLVSGNYIKTYMGIAIVDYKVYIAQVFLWMSIALFTKTSVIIIQYLILDFLALVAAASLKILDFSIDLKLFFVLIVFPFFVNTLVFWISDSLLKKKSFAPEEEILRESFYMRRNSIINREGAILKTMTKYVTIVQIIQLMKNEELTQQNIFKKFQSDKIILKKLLRVISLNSNLLLSELSDFQTIDIRLLIKIISKNQKFQFLNQFQIVLLSYLIKKYFGYELDNQVSFYSLNQFFRDDQKELTKNQHTFMLKNKISFNKYEKCLKKTRNFGFTNFSDFKFFSQNNKIALLDQSKQIQIGILKQQQISTQLKRFEDFQSSETILGIKILSIIINEYERDYILIFTNKRKLKVYETIYYQFCMEKINQFNYMIIKYSKKNKLLYTLDQGSYLTAYKLIYNNKQIKDMQKMVQIQTSSLACCFVELTKINQIAVGVNQGFIHLYDSLTFQEIQLLKQETDLSNSNRIIKKILPSNYSKVLILSYGGGSQIILWRAQPINKYHIEGILRGHSGVILDVQTIQDTEEVVSIDKKMEVKIWNIYFQQQLQSINLERNVFSSISFNYKIIIRQDKSFYIIGKKNYHLKLKRRDDEKNEMKILKIFIDHENKEIIIIQQRQIQVYNLYSKKQVKIYQTLFTDCTVNVLKVKRDYVKKLLFVYNDINQFIIYKEINFMKLCQIENQKWLEFFVYPGHNFILVQDHNYKVMLLKYTSQDIQLLKNFEYMYQSKITCSQYMDVYGLLFAGDNNGSLEIWNLSTNQHLGHKKFGKTKIKEIKFLNKQKSVVYIMTQNYKVYIYFITSPQVLQFQKEEQFEILNFLFEINLQNYSDQIEKVLLFQKLVNDVDKYYFWVLNRFGKIFCFDITAFCLTRNAKQYDQIGKLKNIFVQTPREKIYAETFIKYENQENPKIELLNRKDKIFAKQYLMNSKKRNTAFLFKKLQNFQNVFNFNSSNINMFKIKTQNSLQIIKQEFSIDNIQDIQQIFHDEIMGQLLILNKNQTLEIKDFQTYDLLVHIDVNKQQMDILYDIEHDKVNIIKKQFLEYFWNAEQNGMEIKDQQDINVIQQYYDQIFKINLQPQQQQNARVVLKEQNKENFQLTEYQNKILQKSLKKDYAEQRQILYRRINSSYTFGSKYSQCIVTEEQIADQFKKQTQKNNIIISRNKFLQNEQPFKSKSFVKKKSCIKFDSKLSINKKLSQHIKHKPSLIFNRKKSMYKFLLKQLTLKNIFIQ